MPGAVHPAVDGFSGDLLRRVPVVDDDVIHPAVGVVEAGEGDVFGTGMDEVTDGNRAGETALPVAMLEVAPLGRVVAQVVALRHVAAVAGGNGSQRLVPVQRCQALFGALGIDQRVDALCQVGRRHLGRRRWRMRAGGFGLCVAVAQQQGEK